ncbi:MAG: hypothetical protein K2Q26_03085 [Bdellovibrionales bacterium]|nr:hypothetical protein [Bdellovibrionales bacterium]
MRLNALLRLLVFISCGSVLTLDAYAVDSKFISDYENSVLTEVQPGQLGAMWKARIYGEGADLESQTAQIGGFEVSFESKYKLLENLEARADVRGKFENGRTQSFFGDLEPLSGILVREATINYKPFYSDVLSGKAGIIDQDVLGMPLLMYRRAFPGVSAKVRGQWTEEFSTSVMSQALIPTSSTLSTRTVEKEATPQFNTHTLSLDYDQKTQTGVHLFGLGISGSLYEFKNLPSFVAFESQKRGNFYSQVNGPNNSSFAFPFRGWFAKAFADYRINHRVQPYISYQVIKNEEAPATYNDGQVVAVGTVIMFQNYNWFVTYENFFAESDVVPAFYNSWGYGNTNKKGNGVDTSLEFKKYNFRLRAQYYKADVLNPDGLQQNQDYFYFGVETAYDKI